MRLGFHVYLRSAPWGSGQPSAAYPLPSINKQDTGTEPGISVDLWGCHWADQWKLLVLDRFDYPSLPALATILSPETERDFGALDERKQGHGTAARRDLLSRWASMRAEW